jgi:hypothetical protein
VTAEEIAKVKAEWEEEQRRKKEKEKEAAKAEKEKDGDKTDDKGTEKDKDKDKDKEKKKKDKDLGSPVRSPAAPAVHEKYILHRDFFASGFRFLLSDIQLTDTAQCDKQSIGSADRLRRQRSWRRGCQVCPVAL